MRLLSALLLIGGVLYLAVFFNAPNWLPDLGLDPWLLGGGACVVGLVLLMIDENARHRRKWKMGSVRK